MDAFLIRVEGLPLQPTKQSVAAIRDLMRNAEETRRLALDNAWAPLHFLLTGEYPIPRQKAEELGLSWHSGSLEDAIMGGKPTPIPSAYGPVRYLVPSEVREIANQLDAISSDELESRIDPHVFRQEQVLPEEWDEDSLAEKLSKYFSKLKALYQTAARRGESILIYFA